MVFLYQPLIIIIILNIYIYGMRPPLPNIINGYYITTAAGTGADARSYGETACV